MPLWDSTLSYLLVLAVVRLFLRLPAIEMRETPHTERPLITRHYHNKLFNSLHVVRSAYLINIYTNWTATTNPKKYEQMDSSRVSLDYHLNVFGCRTVIASPTSHPQVVPQY